MTSAAPSTCHARTVTRPTAGRPRPEDAETLLAALLHDGLTTIRNLGTQRSTADELELVHYLADWLHNWPNWMNAASSPTDFSDIWQVATRECHPVVREWARMTVRDYGVSLDALGLPSL
jgi:hypothetical protein